MKHRIVDFRSIEAYVIHIALIKVPKRYFSIIKRSSAHFTPLKSDNFDIASFQNCKIQLAIKKIAVLEEGLSKIHPSELAIVEGQSIKDHIFIDLSPVFGRNST